jgi:hypothetical protein
MATLKQASQANMQGWQRNPMQPVGATPSPAPTGPPPQLPNGGTIPRSPYMLSAMPTMASTVDALQRQFYGGSSLPVHRILPPKNGASQ